MLTVHKVKILHSKRARNETLCYENRVLVKDGRSVVYHCDVMRFNFCERAKMKGIQWWYCYSHSFNLTDTAVSRKVVLQTGKS